MQRVKALIVLILILLNFSIFSKASSEKELIPSLRTQAEIQQKWLKARLERVLPKLMRKYDISMWLVICREYNEDPIFFSLASPSTFSARRRTILVFFDRGPKEGVERLALGGGSHGGLYKVYRDPENSERELFGESQWLVLKKIIEERNPSTIAVNISRTHAFSDGLSAGEWEALQDTLGEKWLRRIVRAELLPIEYLSIRIPEMEPYYKNLMKVAHSLIKRALSSEVIKPGKTNTLDVSWWLRERAWELGAEVWFQPSVSIQRKGFKRGEIVSEPNGVVIQKGDVVHIDFGIKALGLCTDTQHMGYVLNDGEISVPEGIKRALIIANRLQDIVMERIKPGRTGNEILEDALNQMKKEKINGSIYSHTVGDHGHAAGPIIGLWDRQENIPGKGDLIVLPDTWFSIELSITHLIPEWNNQELWVGQEEDAILDSDGKIKWVIGRQEKYHIIK
ncbi:MAG: M24 family metallopeptidase [Candidatus Aminicenantia bacterium]